MINDIIETLRKQGVNVIPVLPKSKRPSIEWKKYQSEKFEGEIPEGYNYAVLGGTISNNLAIIDIDGTTDESFIDKVIPNALKETLVVRTGKGGFHIYLFITGHGKSFNFDSSGVHFDIQIEGKYVVGAGSTHENGRTYDIISETKFIKKVSNDYLKGQLSYFFNNQSTLEMEENVDYNKVAKEGAKEGNRHNTAVKYCNHLLFADICTDIETLSFEMERWNQKVGLPTSELETVIQDCYSRWLPKEDGGAKKFAQHKEGSIDYVADQLMNDYFFRTLKDTREILIYDNGIYVPMGEQEIESLAEQQLDKPRSSTVREVVNLIRRRTMVNREEFDKDPDVLNLLNGLFNMKTLEFKEHTPNYLSRIKINVRYDPLAKCPLIDKFLKEALPDEKARYTAYELAAFTLLRKIGIIKSGMFIGEGANGKSTYLNLIDFMLGEDNVLNNSIHSFTTNRFALADLEGKLANIYADIDSGELKDVGIIKMLIAGDPMTVDEKNKPSFRLRNKAKFLFSANKFPRVNDETLSFFRRFIIVEWMEYFDEDVADENLLGKICEEDEISGFFNKLVTYAVELRKRGKFLHQPDLDDLRKKWEEYADPLQKFTNEELEFGTDYEIDREILYNEYYQYCTERKLGKESKTKFGKFIKELTGVTEGRTGSAGDQRWVYKGITLPKYLRKDSQEALNS